MTPTVKNDWSTMDIAPNVLTTCNLATLTSLAAVSKSFRTLVLTHLCYRVKSLLSRFIPNSGTTLCNPPFPPVDNKCSVTAYFLGRFGSRRRRNLWIYRSFTDYCRGRRVLAPGQTQHRRSTHQRPAPDTTPVHTWVPGRNRATATLPEPRAPALGPQMGSYHEHHNHRESVRFRSAGHIGMPQHRSHVCVDSQRNTLLLPQIHIVGAITVGTTGLFNVRCTATAYQTEEDAGRTGHYDHRHKRMESALRSGLPDTFPAGLSHTGDRKDNLERKKNSSDSDRIKLQMGTGLLVPQCKLSFPRSVKHVHLPGMSVS
jgi:hypothetical protein